MAFLDTGRMAPANTVCAQLATSPANFGPLEITLGKLRVCMILMASRVRRTRARAYPRLFCGDETLNGGVRMYQV